MNWGLKKLDWYIIKKFLVTFFMALLLLAVIIVIFDVSEKIEDFVRKDAPMKEIFLDYYLGFIPYFMNMYSPMFVFLTVIFFTSKMTQDSEVVAMLSSGISFHRLMVPYLVSAVFIMFLSMGLGMWVIPHQVGRKVDFEQKYIPRMKVKIGHDMHYKLENDHFVYLESFSAYNNTAYNFTRHPYGPMETPQLVHPRLRRRPWGPRPRRPSTGYRPQPYKGGLLPEQVHHYAS